MNSFNKRFIPLLLWHCAVWFCSASFLFSQEPEELTPVANEIELFNGKDLDDWIFYSRGDNVERDQVWSVEDGVLKCAGKPAGYLQTKKWFRDYQLELEWRWPGEKLSLIHI